MTTTIEFPFKSDNIEKMNPDDLIRSAKALKNSPRHIANANLAALVIPEIEKISPNPLLDIAWFIDHTTEELIINNERLPLKKYNSASKVAARLVEINNTSNGWEEGTLFH